MSERYAGSIALLICSTPHRALVVRCKIKGTREASFLSAFFALQPVHTAIGRGGSGACAVCAAQPYYSRNSELERALAPVLIDVKVHHHHDKTRSFFEAAAAAAAACLLSIFPFFSCVCVCVWLCLLLLLFPIFAQNFPCVEDQNGQKQLILCYFFFLFYSVSFVRFTCAIPC